MSQRKYGKKKKCYEGLNREQTLLEEKESPPAAEGQNHRLKKKGTTKIKWSKTINIKTETKRMMNGQLGKRKQTKHRGLVLVQGITE